MLSSSKNSMQAELFTVTVAQNSRISGKVDAQNDPTPAIEACQLLMGICDKIGILGHSLRAFLEKTMKCGNDFHKILESLIDSESQELLVLIAVKFRRLKEETTQDSILLGKYIQASIATNILIQYTKLHLESSKQNLGKPPKSVRSTEKTRKYESIGSSLFDKNEKSDNKRSSGEDHSINFGSTFRSRSTGIETRTNKVNRRPRSRSPRRDRVEKSPDRSNSTNNSIYIKSSSDAIKSIVADLSINVSTNRHQWDLDTSQRKISQRLRSDGIEIVEESINFSSERANKSSRSRSAGNRTRINKVNRRPRSRSPRRNRVERSPDRSNSSNNRIYVKSSTDAIRRKVADLNKISSTNRHQRDLEASQMILSQTLRSDGIEIVQESINVSSERAIKSSRSRSTGNETRINKVNRRSLSRSPKRDIKIDNVKYISSSTADSKSISNVCDDVNINSTINRNDNVSSKNYDTCKAGHTFNIKSKPGSSSSVNALEITSVKLTQEDVMMIERILGKIKGNCGSSFSPPRAQQRSEVTKESTFNEKSFKEPEKIHLKKPEKEPSSDSALHVPSAISDMLNDIGEPLDLNIGLSLPQRNRGYLQTSRGSTQRFMNGMYRVAVFGHEYVNLLPFSSNETFNSKTPDSPYQVIKYARHGAEIFKVQEYGIWNEMISAQPHMIFLILGRHDISAYISPQDIADKMVRIKTDLEKSIPNIRIVCFCLEDRHTDSGWSNYQDKLNQWLGAGFDVVIFPTAHVDIGNKSYEALRRVWRHMQNFIEDMMLHLILGQT